MRLTAPPRGRGRNVDEMNRQLLRDWLAWLKKAGMWLAYGPPIKTPMRDRIERLDKILAEGHLLSERSKRMKA